MRRRLEDDGGGDPPKDCPQLASKSGVATPLRDLSESRASSELNGAAPNPIQANPIVTPIDRASTPLSLPRGAPLSPAARLAGVLPAISCGLGAIIGEAGGALARLWVGPDGLADAQRSTTDASALVATHAAEPCGELKPGAVRSGLV